MLRIAAGQWKGRNLCSVAGSVRPTSQKVRAAVFDTLRSYMSLQGTRVLDLFAGSGALGLEAYSQGAAWVVFVERDASTIRTLRKNIAQLKLTSCQIVRAKAEAWLQKTSPSEPFDLALLDAPYHSPTLSYALQLLSAPGWLKPQAMVAAEAHSRQLLSCPPNWKLYKHTRHGNTRLWFYQIASSLPTYSTLS